mmetsp:Transcript_84524/g.148302  ORF Transcript_84524/g.148302 Transcript_84524/m.148302 type:complete len:107 (-) Transcript_84524:1438-1758(-)
MGSTTPMNKVWGEQQLYNVHGRVWLGFFGFPRDLAWPSECSGAQAPAFAPFSPIAVTSPYPEVHGLEIGMTLEMAKAIKYIGQCFSLLLGLVSGACLPRRSTIDQE